MSYKNIEDFQIGDFVQGETQVNQVLFRYEYDLGSKLLFSINKGPFFVTECHPFKTTDGWKSIDFKAASNLKVYDLELSGDHTYYADNYLVHNKSGDYKGLDHRWYSAKDLRDGVGKPWNELVEGIQSEMQGAIDLFQQEYLGVVGGTGDPGTEEDEEVQTEDMGGGKLGDATRELDEARDTFKNKSQELKTGMISGQKKVGKELSTQQAELTSMIGKSNLAQVGARQQKQLTEAATEASEDLGETKDIGMEDCISEI